MPDDRLNFLYYRLSKEDGDLEEGGEAESCSIESQRKCVLRYVKQNFPDETGFEEIVDDGFSGTNMSRPGMRRLLRMVEAGRVRTIVVRDLSRFARNYLEAGHYLEFVFPVYGVRFISVNDGFDSRELGENTGGLELAIRNLINEMYSKDISRKIKSVVDLKKRSGEYVYGTAPYGYKKGAKKNTIVPDEEAARVVKNIFQWAAAGATITQIAGKLNDAGITTPSVYLAAVRGKYKQRAFWTFESVRNILENRIYTGDTEPFKSHVVRVGSNKVKQIPKELREVIPDTHEPLISRELYYQARTTIKSNKKSPRTAPPHPLTSMLVCGCCGNRLTKGKAANKNWRCASGRYQSELGCSDICVNDEKIRTVILRAIVLQCKLVDAKIRTLSKSSSGGKDKRQVLRNECRQLRKKLTGLQEQKMALYESYMTGSLTKEQYVEQKSHASADEENTKALLLISEQKLKESEERLGAIHRQVKEASGMLQYQEITELTPELVKELIRQILVFPDGSIKIEWNFRDEVAKLIQIDSPFVTESAV